jgi:hypothetical protein
LNGGKLNWLARTVCPWDPFPRQADRPENASAIHSLGRPKGCIVIHLQWPKTRVRAMVNNTCNFLCATCFICALRRIVEIQWWFFLLRSH